MVMTLRDYASDIGVSYEAVRQQVKRYSKDLEGHIHQDGRTQYLDEVAISFLNTKRARNPLVIYDKGRDEAIQDLEAEVEILREQLDKTKNKLIAAQERLILSEGAQARLEAAESVQLALTEARDEYKALAEKKDGEAAAARQDADRLRAENTEVSKEAAQLRAENAALAAELAKIDAMGPIQRLFYKMTKG